MISIIFPKLDFVIIRIRIKLTIIPIVVGEYSSF